MFSPKPDNDAIATLAGVAVDVERTAVLRGVDLTVGPGDSVGLVGANGSGKSTLLRVLATLLPPVSGRGEVLGAALGSPDCAAVRPRIALVGHDAALYPRLTLRENLEFVARLTGRSGRAVDDALEAVGLGPARNRPAEVCSQGMRRRAELARVLLTEPGLLLLDEAHAGLDAASIGLVEVVVRQVCDRGGASVVVSHDHPRLHGLADQLVEIVGGRAEPLRDGVVS
ncbi:transcriptional regulator [Saccharomonospora sp. CUA-673]|uniref:ABC transporter ATP-binding protein n=1 Tax=Saccharomonospora sp. CUA-673 TaxID=1904969 RepID=UPI0009633609|nr:ABC transporter ATP-binding protein [Saccharomonospora sp. CUA-673]OLT41767.1 transcriptional regulator [Saccharomonospora sp. CUA-673]